MAKFQSEHYATGLSGKNQHAGSKAMTLKDVTDTCRKAAEHGLSHSFQFRLLGGGEHAVARCVVYHSSGEQIFSEVQFSTTFKGARSQEQALGSAKTYYHKYMLSGLYGLANSNEDPVEDDGEGTVAVADLDKAAADLAASMDSTPAPAAKKVSGDDLTSEEVDECKRIIKSSPDIKAAFKAEFFKEAPKLLLTMLKHKTHLDFLKQQEAYEKELKKAVQADVDKVLSGPVLEPD